MAQNIVVNGVTYNGVASISVPLSAGGGNAVFPDTSSGDAAAGDIASGKKAWVDGVEVTGTATGGGSTPSKGFLPTAWNANGYTTDGVIYGLTSVPNGFFSNQTTTTGAFIHLEDLTFTPNTTAIGSNAFAYCDALALTNLPSSVTSINGSAFNYCSNLALTELPSGLTAISANAFYYCPLLAITSIPAKVTSIGTYSFRGCTNITTLEILGNPTIGGTSTTSSSFRGCTGLTSVTVGATGKPMTMTKLPNYAFHECSNLTSITVYTTGGVNLATAPFGATNATVTYLSA